jgi:large subunit ribosomal protein L25
MLVVNIVAAPSAEEMDAEGGGEEAAEPAAEASESTGEGEAEKAE